MHSYILFFTTIGKVYWIKVHELPQASRAARGKPIVNLLSLEPGEKVSAFLTVREFQEGRYIVFATKNGLIKKTELMAYANPRASGIRAIGLEERDEVIGVRLTDGNQEIILSTADGQSIRFKEEQVRPTGRGTFGVVGMRLDAGDKVVSMEILSLGADILTVAEGGYGKRTEMDEYRSTIARRQGRHHDEDDGQNRSCRRRSARDRRRPAHDDYQRRENHSPAQSRDIRVIGRNTQGVRLIELKKASESCRWRAWRKEEEEGRGREDRRIIGGLRRRGRCWASPT